MSNDMNGSETTSKIKVLIADDHAIVRMGLASLLGTKPDIEVIGEASNGEIAVRKAIKLLPDIVIMDLMMPKMDGVDATRELREKLPTAKVLLLTTFGTSERLVRALEAGAAGAIMKSSTNTALLSAVRSVAAGKRVIDDDIRQLVAESSETRELSPQQAKILESITRGLTNREIARQFDISPESVKTQIARLLEKIGAANRSEAASIALKKHLLKL